MHVEMSGWKKAAALTALAALLVSCATSPDAYREIDRAVEAQHFSAGIAAIEKGQSEKKPIYPEKNAIMLFLDKGLLEHYAQNYAASSRDLQEAERLIEEAYTKSITAGIMSYIANDNTRDYPGEDFEDIYINVFNALNYYRKGDTEGALVEIRKLSMSSGKLDMLARKYDYKDPGTGESLGDFAEGEGAAGQVPQGKPVDFSNSALARYLGALFYLADGNTDSARIEFEAIARAFEGNRNVYRNSVPKAVEEAQNVPDGKARLNIISFTGLSPVKEEELIVYYFPFFQHEVLQAAVFKLPKLVERPSRINRVEAAVHGGDTFTLELLEDIGAVVKETFAVRYANIVLKTYIRTILKYAAADIAAAETVKQQGDVAGALIAIAARTALEVSERADIRMSRYLPDRAYIGGVNLEPGTYTITINYYQGNTLVTQEVQHNFAVKAGGLNLIESVNLN